MRSWMRTGQEGCEAGKRASLHFVWGGIGRSSTSEGQKRTRKGRARGRGAGPPVSRFRLERGGRNIIKIFIPAETTIRQTCTHVDVRHTRHIDHVAIIHAIIDRYARRHPASRSVGQGGASNDASKRVRLPSNPSPSRPSPSASHPHCRRVRLCPAHLAPSPPLPPSSPQSPPSRT